jgi:hypothetical protein
MNDARWRKYATNDEANAKNAKENGTRTRKT